MACDGWWWQCCRDEITALSNRREFYFNATTLRSQWEPPFDRNRFIPDAPLAPPPGRLKKKTSVNKEALLTPLQLLYKRFPVYTGMEMCTMVAGADLRRRLAGWNEYTSKCHKTIFYIHDHTWKLEMNVLRLQRLYRQKFSRPVPRCWYSRATSWSKPEEVFKEEVNLSGWALMQRRSELSRTFLDADDVSWQERKETETLELFYHEPLDLRWQWKKPPTLPVAVRIRQMELADLKVDDKVG